MKTLNKLLITAIITLAITTPIHAQTPATEHNHGHDQQAASALTLDHGKKWQSDAPLRQGMQSISDAVMKNVDAFHHDKLTKPDADKLAQHINEQVTFLVTNCKLQPQADATLHVIIGELLTGADALKKDPNSMQGMPTLVKALMQYPEYFEHKGWKGIKH
ncbi:MAG: hypothetical protein HYZ31_07245 [Gammaproteobacteria bacterium]|nr:hypothetical protein [Gammaproteobacteria bacterium]